MIRFMNGLVGIGLVGMVATSAFSSDRVIYGDDNRRDVYEVQDEMFLKIAKGTAMLMSSSDLRDSGNGTFTLPTTTFGQARNLCDSEPYREQANPGFCSGFLVGKDIFVTAGHCITTASRCSSTSFVFDYNANEDGLSPSEVSQNNVYKCKEIISRAQGTVAGEKLDYAVVRLDREVTGREPVAFRNEGAIEVGTELVMIGHPAGLPSKIEDGGVVRSLASGYFIATTDSYGGNSGSAVFNRETGVVEGILVRGETDYKTITENGRRCTVSNTCDEAGCRGEDISNALQFAAHIPAEVPAPEPAPLPEPAPAK